MTTSVLNELRQGYRDALLTYYLGQYAPANNLDTLIETPEDVYEYLLIDPLVTNEVKTARVAQAMSSLQQYINGIAMNMEPGYSTGALDSAQLMNWHDGGDEYALWSGDIELDTYPENYLDPGLRESKTRYFSDLQTMLSQNTLDETIASQAVLTYLNNFEQVANLDIVSGYIDGNVIDKDKYYFIGRTKNSPVDFYWRTLDMSQNASNIVALGAWSEWQKIAVTLNTDALVGLPRPMVFNNRLYIIWYEKSTGSTSDGTTSATITMNASSIQFDGSWSAPLVISTITNTANPEYNDLFDATSYMTLALANGNVSNNSFNSYLALYAKNSSQQYVSLSAVMDPWGNIKQEDLLNSEKVFDKFYGDDNQQLLQFNISGDGDVVITLIPSNVVQDDFNYQMTPFMPAEGAVSAKVENDTLKLTLSNSINIFQFQTIHPDETHGYNGHKFDVYMTMYPFVPTPYARGSFVLGDDGGKHDVTCFELVVDGSSDHHSYKSYNIITYNYDDSRYNVNNINFDTDNYMYLNKNTTYYYMAYITKSNKTYRSYKFTLPEVTVYNPQWKIAGAEGSYSGNSFTNYTDVDDISINATTTLQCAFTGAADYIFSWGVWLNETISDTDIQNRYCTVQYTVSVVQLADITPPKIAQRTEGNSVVQYLDFMGNTFSANTALTITPLRLNTLFAKELINKANISIDELLTWKTQLTSEPAIVSGDPAQPMDFYGANGLYFWELFFYMPWLVAWRLNQEAQYDAATHWYNYIFDPSARGRQSGDALYPQPDYWNVRPLVEPASPNGIGDVVQMPVDPDVIAVAEPVHYQKTIVMNTIQNLIAQGDEQYRLLTNDGLSQAKLRYCQVKDLLGQRPDSDRLSSWQPATLNDISGSISEALRMFEEPAGLLAVSYQGPQWSALNASDSAIFMAPLNVRLLRYWNTIAARFYNLRHNLSIDGQPIVIPLYAPSPLKVNALHNAFTRGTLTNLAAAIGMVIPPYRFSVMLDKARQAAGLLGQYGQTLLSYYERGDSARLQEMQQQQAFNLSAFTLSLQQQQIDALNADYDALVSSRTMTEQRYQYYQSLSDKGLSDNEKGALDKLGQSVTNINAATGIATAAAALNLMPNIYGLAIGGEELGAAVSATGFGLDHSAQALGTNAQRMQMSEEYRRRGEEWQFQSQQAQAEMAAIDKQLAAMSIRQQSAQTSLQQAQQEQANLQATLNFLTTRFSQASLYNWLNGQLSALYYQAYDAVLSLCLSAQACWQYEMGDVTSTFIQTGAWNDSYHGLLVGETLQLNLQQMESAWLSRNQRRLEVTKTLSLKQLLGDSSFATLISTGNVAFTLSEALFDDDYPGHYLRQIKYLTLSLPTLIGPYQDVRATLTQTGSKTLLKADIAGVKYLNGMEGGNDQNVIANLRASQQIAVSSGMSDSGLFTLNFGDERYLPFEGTGAVSSWQLAFPRPDSDEQAAILSALNDVIVQVHYTAVDGGSSFASAVESLNA